MIKLDNTRLLGHRGARHEALENTLFGFEYAYNLRTQGLAGIEFDVQLTADGHLVVFHDETLYRLCGVQSRIDQLSLVEVQRHLQSGHPIITLDRLAALLCADSESLARSSLPQSASAPFTHIELEIKTHKRTPYPALIQALTRYLTDSPLASLPIVLTSFDVQLLAHLQRHKVLSTFSRGLLIQAPRLLKSAPRTALQLGCTQLGIHYPLLTPTFIQQCHRLNLSVSAWTVNDIDMVQQLVKWQVNVIITDIPAQLLQ